MDVTQVFPGSHKVAISDTPTFHFPCKTEGKTTFLQIRVFRPVLHFPCPKSSKMSPKACQKSSQNPQKCFQKRCHNLRRFFMQFLLHFGSDQHPKTRYQLDQIASRSTPGRPRGPSPPSKRPQNRLWTNLDQFGSICHQFVSDFSSFFG